MNMASPSSGEESWFTYNAEIPLCELSFTTVFSLLVFLALLCRFSNLAAPPQQPDVPSLPSDCASEQQTDVPSSPSACDNSQQQSSPAPMGCLMAWISSKIWTARYIFAMFSVLLAWRNIYLLFLFFAADVPSLPSVLRSTEQQLDVPSPPSNHASAQQTA